MNPTDKELRPALSHGDALLRINELLRERDELIAGLEDIKDHSGMPGFDNAKWSNYCHVIAFELVDRIKGNK